MIYFRICKNLKELLKKFDAKQIKRLKFVKELMKSFF